MKRTWVIVCAAVLLAACGKSDQAVEAAAKKVVRARKLAEKLAFEGYPSWSVANPTKMCPESLDALFAATGVRGTKDPWGNDYQMLCGDNLPPRTKGLVVLSFGPDGKQGTPDDISSWDLVNR